jgi:hypothetical protein
MLMNGTTTSETIGVERAMTGSVAGEQSASKVPDLPARHSSRMSDDQVSGAVL